MRDLKRVHFLRAFMNNPFRFFLALVLAGISLDAQEKPRVMPLWPNGAPGFEERRNEPELAASYWVKNVHNPSITIFLPPKEKANGTAVIVCPGGGFRELGFNGEGVAPAQFLTNLGVAAFALKYRLPRETNSPYSLPKHAIEDGQRAMRLVRSHADEWGIDPNRIGIMGFSAGGEVASFVAYTPSEGNPDASDPVDRLSARANFQIMIYPGPLGIPETVPTNAPPSFWVAANDDRQPARTIASMLPKYSAAKVPIEVHLFAKGGHAFNMGNRSKLVTLKGWPNRLTDWLADNDLLSTSQTRAATTP
jgi:acetyl esterase/lipase